MYEDNKITIADLASAAEAIDNLMQEMSSVGIREISLEPNNAGMSKYVAFREGFLDLENIYKYCDTAGSEDDFEDF